MIKSLIIQSMERKKMDKYREEVAGEGWFSIPGYNKSSSTCKLNRTILVCMVVEKSLTKNFSLQSTEGKKIEQIQDRICRRRLVLNPTIQQVVINLHTKYYYSSLHGCGEIFDETFYQKGDGLKNRKGWKDERTDRRTDGQM